MTLDHAEIIIRECLDCGFENSITAASPLLAAKIRCSQCGNDLVEPVDPDLPVSDDLEARRAARP